MVSSGQSAPLFCAPDQSGVTVCLSDLIGRRVLLYFYPKDDTPGCTAEACSLRDGHQALLDAGYTVLGVSPDPVAKHLRFSSKYQLPFRLLADEDLAIARAYGVWGPKKFMGREYEGILRTTFLIDEQGIVDRVITQVRTKDHADQVLNG